MSSFGSARTPPRALLALALAGGAALAQPKPAPPKDTQARFEPPSGPGAGQAFLNQFEGEWSRTVSHLEDSGRKLIHQQFNQGADGKEHLLMELILVKKPARK